MNCTPRKACHRIWAILVLILAFGLGVFVVIAAPRLTLIDVALTMRFLHFIIAVLGIGALIKYLFTCGPCACYCAKKEDVRIIETQPK